MPPAGRAHPEQAGPCVTTGTAALPLSGLGLGPQERGGLTSAGSLPSARPRRLRELIPSGLARLSQVKVKVCLGSGLSVRSLRVAKLIFKLLDFGDNDRVPLSAEH